MKLNEFNKMDILLIGGLYGAGKTRFIMEYFKNAGRKRISRSEIRKLMFEMTNLGQEWSSDSFNEADDSLVKHIERKIIEHHFHKNSKIIIVNTFTTLRSRKKFIQMAKDTNKSIGIIFLNTPIKKCIDQNKESSVNVPDIIINSMYSRLELPKEEEGFQILGVIDKY